MSVTTILSSSLETMWAPITTKLSVDVEQNSNLLDFIWLHTKGTPQFHKNK